MKRLKTKTMRDAFIEQIYKRMSTNDKIFFVSADFGSPVLDKIRTEYSDRFINVGIAEQNLVNVATGLAFEGFDVYAYAIAAFLSMRAYEQIRTNVALFSQIRDVNINLIGVGAGVSYVVSGPTHHCLEDITLMNLLPNMVLFSPCDWVTTEKFADYTINVKKPKYLRFDAQPLPSLCEEGGNLDIVKGFFELKKGEDVCLVSTGYMTHRAMRIADLCRKENIDCGVIDLFMLKPVNKPPLLDALKKYKAIIVMEEAFSGKGGLDSIIGNVLGDLRKTIGFRAFGFKDEYVFELGSREQLHVCNGLGNEVLIQAAKNCLIRY